MRASLHRIGNSRGVIIPKPILAQVGLTDEFDMAVEDDAIVLRRAQPPVRAGWEADSEAIARLEHDGLVRPAFANADDADLEW